LFEGFCEGKKYAEMMKDSHVFILPSISDCNPLTVIEGLFSGNIIVVSKGVCSYPEAVDGNGYVIRSNSPDDIFNCLCGLTEMPAGKLEQMATRSLKLAKNFTTKRSAEGFLAAILAE
jgi:glycosyltransferase involved in cell wall biosynthesis